MLVARPDKARAAAMPLKRAPRDAEAGISLVSLRRFWAVAARRNSSRAPQGPRSRKRSSFRTRFRWAKSISTFFRWRIEVQCASVLAISRVTSRAASWIERVTFGSRARRAGNYRGRPVADVDSPLPGAAAPRERPGEGGAAARRPGRWTRSHPAA